MDDITYTTLELAFILGKTSQKDLNTLVKNRFTPSDYNDIDRIVRELFMYNYFETQMIGVIIPANPLENMVLTENSKQIFYREKIKRGRQIESKNIDDKVKTMTISNYKWSFRLSILTIFFIGASTYFQMTEKVSPILQQLQLQEQISLKNQDSILKFQKGIKESFRQAVKDSFYAPFHRQK